VTAFAPSTAVALAGIFLARAGISVAAPTIFSLAGRIVPQDPHLGNVAGTTLGTCGDGLI
jgi:hypothetical protein